MLSQSVVIGKIQWHFQLPTSNFQWTVSHFVDAWQDCIMMSGSICFRRGTTVLKPTAQCTVVGASSVGSKLTIDFVRATRFMNAYWCLWILCEFRWELGEQPTNWYKIPKNGRKRKDLILLHAFFSHTENPLFCFLRHFSSLPPALEFEASKNFSRCSIATAKNYISCSKEGMATRTSYEEVRTCQDSGLKF